MPASAALADHLVEDRHEHVEPLDREARLARERALQEALERLDLRQPIEQRDRIDRIGRRAEASALGRLAQPLALFGHEHVRVVVAGRRTVDAAERLDDLVSGRDAVERTGDEVRGKARRSSSVTPWVSASSDGSPTGGRAPSGSSRAARCP